MSEKQLLKMWAEKRLLTELMNSMLIRINQQIILNVHNIEGIPQNLIFPFFNESEKTARLKFIAKKK